MKSQTFPLRLVSNRSGASFWFSCFNLLLLLTLCFSLTSSAFAQTAKKEEKNRGLVIQRFINEDTLLVVRINLDNIDFNRVNVCLGQTANQFFTTFGIPEESRQLCLDEAQKTIDTIVKDLSEQRDLLVKQLGFSEVYYVVQTSKGQGTCFIIPLSNASGKQVGRLRDLNSEINFDIYQKDFILGSLGSIEELKTYYDNFKPNPNDSIEDFFTNLGKDKTLSFYCGRIKIRPLLQKVTIPDALMRSSSENSSREEKAASEKGNAKNSVKNSKKNVAQNKQSVKNTSNKSSFAEEKNDVRNNSKGETFSQQGSNKKVGRKSVDPIENAPRYIKDGVETFDIAFTGAFGYLDFSEFKVRLVLKFSTTSYAGKFQESLAQGNNEYAPLLSSLIQAKLSSENEDFDKTQKISLFGATISKETSNGLIKYRLFPILREFLNAEIRQGLPKQDGTNLVYEDSLLAEVKKIGPNTLEISDLYDVLTILHKQLSKLAEIVELEEAELPESIASSESTEQDNGADVSSENINETAKPEPSVSTSEPTSESQSVPVAQETTVHPTASIPAETNPQPQQFSSPTLPSPDEPLVDPRVEKLNQAKKKIGSSAGKLGVK